MRRGKRMHFIDVSFGKPMISSKVDAFRSFFDVDSVHEARGYIFFMVGHFVFQLKFSFCKCQSIIICDGEFENELSVFGV